MADKIIQTQKREERRPGLAFLLSLFFTGLGQMYNGDLPKGAVFLLMRTVPLLALPAAMVTRDAGSAIIPFMGLMAAALAITIASPVEALVRAKRDRELPVRAYNTPYGYGGYTAATAVITFITTIVLAAFFSIGQVTGRTAEPLLERDDIVLIYRYAPQGFRRGDLVFTGSGEAVRVVALAGDLVKYENNIFYVRGTSLPLGYLTDDTIGRFTASRGDVLSEMNEGRKYPVRFKQSAEVTLKGIGPIVAKGCIIVASDSRLVKDFARSLKTDDIKGRVDGILFSSYLRKIGMDAFGNLK
ncbi:MAG: hypothetical protein KA369_13660 [Spirochaetes bacterium]|nr:hypothetical protein [Spirochaetota bacterium]